MNGVRVRCPRCGGNGTHPHYVDGSLMPRVVDPYFIVKCEMCNGFGALVATELKTITDTRKLEEIDRSAH